MPQDRPAIAGHEIRVVSISRDEYLADIEAASARGYRAAAADYEPVLRQLASRLDAPAIKNVLTTKEAASLTGVKPGTVLTWIADGLPAVRRGNGYQIKRTDLEAWRTRVKEG